jgi:hypothetical protein
MNEDDWSESVDEPETSETYLLRGRDRSVVAAAIQLLEKVVRASFTRPAELVSVAKALHLLKRLPQVTDGEVALRVSLNGPRRWFGEREIWHWWNVEINSLLIEIYSGGHFYRQSTGGDSFTCFQWDAEPGEEPNYANYLDQLHMVDDARPFHLEVAALDLGEPGFSLEVEDQDNPFLEEMTASDASDDSSGSPENEVDDSATEAEKALAGLADEEQGRRLEMTYSGEPERCGSCGNGLTERQFFVDGRLRGSLMWACLCAECFGEQGEGIRWGDGQLYKRQAEHK